MGEEEEIGSVLVSFFLFIDFVDWRRTDQRLDMSVGWNMYRRGFRNNETYRQSERGAGGYSIDQIDWGGHEWG